MKKSLLNVSILLTVISQPGIAAERCEAIFGEPANRSLEVTGPSLLTQKQYQDFLNSVDALLGPLQTPENLKVTMTEPGVGGVFSKDDNYISVPSTFLKYGVKKGSHPKFTTAILAHEYGHAVLNQNIKKYSPLWEAYEIERTGSMESAQAALKETMAALDAIRNAKTPEEKSAAEANKVKVFAEIKVSAERSADRVQVLKIMTAYNEMFADTVSVIRFQDPRIIYKAISGDALIASSVKMYKDPATKYAVRFSEKDLKRITLENRQFDKSWGPANLQQWQKDIAATIANKEMHPYLLLAPARSALWDAIKNKVHNPEEQQQILAKLLQVIGKHFEANFQDIKNVRTLNPLEFNQSLIRDIEKAFAN
ncbi:hypothetical protein ACLVWU_05370 [Bdellovibrio sp. HCB290]|uniref:hypothetical protein n=1 Tax=Bdellovibrio sp. HCB290 TaxID=3394356 RepID=UPI0039B38AC4